jgi:hypothetical protein
MNADERRCCGAESPVPPCPLPVTIRWRISETESVSIFRVLSAFICVYLRFQLHDSGLGLMARQKQRSQSPEEEA